MEPNLTKVAKKLNYSPVVGRPNDSVIFIRLPKALWRSAGICNCPECKGEEGYWDTLAVNIQKPTTTNDYAWIVHHPENTNQ